MIAFAVVDAVSYLSAAARQERVTGKNVNAAARQVRVTGKNVSAAAIIVCVVLRVASAQNVEMCVQATVSDAGNVEKVRAKKRIVIAINAPATMWSKTRPAVCAGETCAMAAKSAGVSA